EFPANKEKYREICVFEAQTCRKDPSDPEVSGKIERFEYKSKQGTIREETGSVDCLIPKIPSESLLYPLKD
ncbi:MAG: hypothetical protein WB630_25305, partial [Candidatus Acidiferrales bacterium]